MALPADVRRVLLVNSDLAKNRGDRAIAEGIVALVREVFPDARITGISEHAERDGRWLGIDFLAMDTQSLNPVDLVRLLREARHADLVLWGGGEILKDYTNRAALWYWCLKMFLVMAVNREVVGAFQGIGRTRSPSSRRLVAAVVRRTRRFVVRDQESADKLVAWGVPPERIIASSDPAVLPDPASSGPAAAVGGSAVDGDFLARDFACMGPRSWFHYRESGILPYKYTRMIRGALGLTETPPSPKVEAYRSRLVEMVDELLGRDLSVLLVPMHMAEDDAELCRHLAARCAAPERVRVLDEDDVSPAQLRAVMSRATVMVGFRLHSTIVAVSSGVPALNVYYVDKGRVFFEQLEQTEYSLPVEDVLEGDFLTVFRAKLDRLSADREAVRTAVQKRVADLRSRIRADFARAVDG